MTATQTTLNKSTETLYLLPAAWSADDLADICPACNGTGYLTASPEKEEPCFNCPGPQLSRYPTTYDGVGVKGLVDPCNMDPETKTETRIRIHSDMGASQQLKRPRWSLSMYWRGKNDGAEADVECSVEEECSISRRRSKKHGPRRSKRWNARAETHYAETAMQELAREA
ncbi:uncharacterized protein SPPG_08213 [Spizellomyces punctatus DAOM BR117]|uniref:Uncharacterized protein n=1 Tax=Spizellomyces punctatus (strain DAOM BR117) TaxID=645134 RepID=A0A0L0H511_SPIPD|nr:uncharacterized protein SPPG_08213 [Spizellomyces punctatus DAOM BR117]KNC96307.1 hypothetical protein SPPG_08213 [Spizellomyces punctatus DAOM BR117]|eukprot:XP_016604347.1 hypothetical protein SPPG_08213 [Spizellomyces punctatus DAOM BR117]